MKTQAILDKIILVVLNISIWQGRKALQLSDLAITGIDVDKLPPESLATRGSKRIISPDAVKVFKAIKRMATKFCLRNGVRFAGDGYAVPREKVEAISQELMRLKEEFEGAKEHFLTIYVDEVEKWIASNQPEWAPMIRSAIDPPSQIRKAMSFNFAAIDVKAPEEITANGLHDEVDSLYGQLCHEVRLSARRAFENTYVGKQEITRKTLRPIKIIREKLVGLMFLDPGIAEIVQVIDDTLDKLPEDGPIKGTDLNMVAGLLGRQLATMGQVVTYELGEEEYDEEPVEMIPDEEIINQTTGRVAPISWDF